MAMWGARTTSALVLVSVIGCGRATGEPAGKRAGNDERAPVGAADRDARFDAAVARLAAARQQLAARFAGAASAKARAAIRAEARAVLLAAVDDELFPPWLGTPWGLGSNSTATRPHEPDMVVGCSYFVTSILGNAGVVLDNRYKFAQAPALEIQRSLAPGEGAIHRILSIPPDQLERRIRDLGDGLYLIGLNNHVGFVVVRRGAVRFVHASYTGAQVVTDEPLISAEAIANSQRAGYFVSPVIVAGTANDWLIDRWLTGATVRFRPRRG